MQEKFESGGKRLERKRILVLYYSQTGQLASAVRSMLSPLEGYSAVEIVYESLQPKKPYPFPWPILDFMDVFPESVYMDPPEMKPVGFDPDGHFDLVILAYQVWFLSPSLPVTGFLKSSAARVLKDKPVITFIACRNMWLTAQEKMKDMLKSLGATLIDNAVLIDQGPVWATFVTTPRWLWTGKRNGFWGIFPPAGVSQKDIADTVRFGRAIVDSLTQLEAAPGKSLLWGLEAVKVNPRFISAEKVAHRSFIIWGRLFRLIGKQGKWLRKQMMRLYLVILICMIVLVLPISIVIRAISYPFLRRRLEEGVKRLEEPSGSSTERMDQYL